MGVQFLADRLVGDRLAEPPDVGQRVALPDHRTPAAGAEDDLRVGVLPPHEQPLEDDVPGYRQLLGGVDAVDLVRVVDLVAVDPPAGVDDPAREVGQTVLARDRHRRKRAQEQAMAGHIPPNVDFLDALMGCGLVRALHYRHDPPALPHDTTVRRVRVLDHGGQDRQVRPLEPVPGEQPQQGLRAQQRRVGVGDQLPAGCPTAGTPVPAVPRCPAPRGTVWVT